ncbi:hypothetical protein ABUW04_19095 [Streptacidiphilus sp. N1-10]|uniref:DUF4118 domain-containing protein n=1 Tax=Streptacidiphilus jeojiensis TaxID=3229225 RepID=A0ABV6XQ22_9ACTN
MSYTLLRPTARSRALPVATATGRQAGLRAPMLAVLSFAVAAPLSVLLAAVGERPYPVFELVVMSLAAFAVGCAADLAGSVLVGLVFWLFLDGFDLGRWGVLGWDGHTSAVRLAVLVAAGVVGAVVGTAVRAAQRNESSDLDEDAPGDAIDRIEEIPGALPKG